jgi:hypothetical protein
MNVAYRLWQAGDKIIPGNQGGIMTGNQHIIDTGPRQWRQIVPCHSTKPPPRPVPDHRISDFFVAVRPSRHPGFPVLTAWITMPLASAFWPFNRAAIKPARVGIVFITDTGQGYLDDKRH